SSTPSSASATSACRPGSPSPPRSTSTATTGWPASSTPPPSASCSTTMPSPNSTTPARRRPWPTASLGSAGARSSAPWPRRVTPSRGELGPQAKAYYGVTDQPEYSTAPLSRARQALTALSPRLLDHACLHFSAQDILRFLGRRLHPRFDGEVLTDCKKRPAA